ncbi:sulfur carrier protein ThiS [Acinetobacter rathckeae]|uniref:sulfur carrier protein ThiS n=1 Tax=Acinetobacter rathckeae TaxID=2605272 RepID=UPI0018A31A20|nr:sulfur carrier protein ThiS [Acinetobacter rathckeae]MBF7688747.1 sulfur carrier protein ThiS [Acinetobacter rathckeae]MBF7696140.1 sulfur carrier protein ThiS [Acinetobacter rathckeae]
MKIIFNGQVVVTSCVYLKEFLLSKEIDIQSVATAVNTDFVPRSLYATTELTEGMSIEVVSPMQGG